MGACIRISLLGPFAIEQIDITRLNRKTRAILAYLAATGTAHTRQALYDMFCQEANDPAGLLRWHLSQLRQHLGPESFQITRQEVAIAPAQVETDLRPFVTGMGNPTTQTTAQLHHTANLYRGNFLEGLTLHNAPEFELWLLGERSRFQLLYEKGAAVLVDRCIQRQAYPQAIALSQRLLQKNCNGQA